MSLRLVLRTIVLIAVSTIGLAACTAINEVVSDRDLVCHETADHLCLRIADLASTDSNTVIKDTGAKRPHMVVEVQATDCADLGDIPPATACWDVTGTSTPDIASFSTFVYESPDGTLHMGNGGY